MQQIFFAKIAFASTKSLSADEQISIGSSNATQLINTFKISQNSDDKSKKFNSRKQKADLISEQDSSFHKKQQISKKK
jgi:hypothetical protein